MKDLGMFLPFTDELVSKLLSLKDIEGFFMRGFKDCPNELSKPVLTVSDVNQCLELIETDFKTDFLNSEKEILLTLVGSSHIVRIEILKALEEAIENTESVLRPGNTKAFRQILEKNKSLTISKFEEKVDPDAKIQHGLRIRELVQPLSFIGEKYLMEYEDEPEETNNLVKKDKNKKQRKRKASPNLKDYIQPAILAALCKKLEEEGWIKKEGNGQFVWQYKDAEKDILNEFNKLIRTKTISVRETSLVSLSMMVDKRKWMFLPDRNFNKIRQRAIAFLNFFGLLPKEENKIDDKVRYFYTDSLGDTEFYSENFSYLDDLKQYQLL